MKNKQTKVKAILKSKNSIIPITTNPQPHCPVKYPFFLYKLFVEYLNAYKA